MTNSCISTCTCIRYNTKSTCSIETVELIEPSVLATPAPFANQFHDTKFAPLPLKSELLPNEKPSELKEVKPAASVASAPVVLGIKYFVAVLTISLILPEFAFVLSFNQTKSGAKSKPVIDCVEALPV
jgi:hypothetical protein